MTTTRNALQPSQPPSDRKVTHVLELSRPISRDVPIEHQDEGYDRDQVGEYQGHYDVRRKRLFFPRLSESGVEWCRFEWFRIESRRMTNEAPTPETHPKKTNVRGRSKR